MVSRVKKAIHAAKDGEIRQLEDEAQAKEKEAKRLAKEAKRDKGKAQQAEDARVESVSEAQEHAEDDATSSGERRASGAVRMASPFSACSASPR